MRLNGVPSMRELTVPEAGPKRKLLDAAEQLFAENGFDGVAIRDVTKVVGMNIAAVNYHFGSRDEMIALVMVRYLVPIREGQIMRLDAVEQKWTGKSLPLLEVLEAFVKPISDQFDKSNLSERSYFQLIGRILAKNGDGMSGWIEKDLHQLTGFFIRAFEKALPGIRSEDLAYRFHFMQGSLIHLLTHHKLLKDGNEMVLNMETAISRFVRFAVAGMSEGVEVEVPDSEGPQTMFDF